MQKSVFCMVVSSTRLIQGMACFLSLYKNVCDLKIYILCIDDKCYEFLKKINFDKLVLVKIPELNRKELLEIRTERELNQYCWTLKPSFIKYVFNLDDSIERVTYIDSDLFFFQNPNIIFKNQPDASVLLSSGEIFLPMYSKELNHYVQHLTGNFNSGFISFKKDINGIECVNWWDKKCIDSCTSNPEDNKFGDQKYLDDMPFLFKNVQEITTPGVNIAHWNYAKYNFTIVDDNVLVNNNRLIFYHFSGFRIISKYDIRQIHEQDRINPPFIYQIYRKLLRELIDEVEKIDSDFKEYRTIAAIDDN
ncbi:putative nucleotide-diphospho-sugar transferase [Clostridium sp. DJ247]|uniref:putative nucleotide-diphospho-sugar transferase n=1 Tax=Clostridium sp. DJ247 TaxID=2726188 RepID=UPI0016264ABB|nr:putative nucleotide-diphospho-sugar transferase [Clostridium sp. DJ247]MBC2580169.1 hypothetical protein [Clostridium sp. DJ247]